VHWWHFNYCARSDVYPSKQPKQRPKMDLWALETRLWSPTSSSSWSPSTTCKYSCEAWNFPNAVGPPVQWAPGDRNRNRSRDPWQVNKLRSKCPPLHKGTLCEDCNYVGFAICFVRCLNGKTVGPKSLPYAIFLRENLWDHGIILLYYYIFIKINSTQLFSLNPKKSWLVKKGNDFFHLMFLK